ncbi:MAG: META domain-containing protein [Candidatus Limnocylindria bacterium]
MTVGRMLLPVLVLLAACAQTSGATLEGRTFLSTSVTKDGVERPLVADTRIRLSLEDGRLGASAGCNIYGADYSISNGHLVASGGSMTEMGCDDERSAQDEWLFAFLGSSPTIRFDSDGMVLEYEGTVITLLDREIADPDLALVGPTWTVASIIDGDAVSSFPTDVAATLQFHADGTVAVNTGCNSGGGTYTLSGSGIQFSNIALTERFCEGPAGQMEAAVTPILQAASVSYQIEARNLTVMAGSQGLGLTGE